MYTSDIILKMERKSFRNIVAAGVVLGSSLVMGCGEENNTEAQKTTIPSVAYRESKTGLLYEEFRSAQLAPNIIYLQGDDIRGINRGILEIGKECVISSIDHSVRQPYRTIATAYVITQSSCTPAFLNR